MRVRSRAPFATLGLGLAGLVLFALFVVIELSSSAPLVDFAIFRKGAVGMILAKLYRSHRN